MPLCFICDNKGWSFRNNIGACVEWTKATSDRPICYSTEARLEKVYSSMRALAPFHLNRVGFNIFPVDLSIKVKKINQYSVQINNLIIFLCKLRRCFAYGFGHPQTTLKWIVKYTYSLVSRKPVNIRIWLSFSLVSLLWIWTHMSIIY